MLRIPNRSKGIITAWSFERPGGNDMETGISPVTGDNTLTGTSCAFIISDSTATLTCRADSSGGHHDSGISAAARLFWCERHLKRQVLNTIGFRLSEIRKIAPQPVEDLVK
jgi:hypothetical protein